jgi:hypothetical protein
MREIKDANLLRSIAGGGPGGNGGGAGDANGGGGGYGGFSANSSSGFGGDANGGGGGYGGFSANSTAGHGSAFGNPFSGLPNINVSLSDAISQNPKSYQKDPAAFLGAYALGRAMSGLSARGSGNPGAPGGSH